MTKTTIYVNSSKKKDRWLILDKWSDTERLKRHNVVSYFVLTGCYCPLCFWSRATLTTNVKRLPVRYINVGWCFVITCIKKGLVGQKLSTILIVTDVVFVCVCVFLHKCHPRDPDWRTWPAGLQCVWCRPLEVFQAVGGKWHAHQFWNVMSFSCSYIIHQSCMYAHTHAHTHTPLHHLHTPLHTSTHHYTTSTHHYTPLHNLHTPPHTTTPPPHA